MKSWVTVLLSIVATMTLVGCDENGDIQSWMERANSLRTAAERQIPNAPYRREQHQSFKDYFAHLNTMALNLGRDSGLRQRFNSSVTHSNMGEVCQKVFMPAAQWRALNGSCTKNRFYLCAEEVRAYGDSASALRDALTQQNRARFDGTTQCSTLRSLDNSL